MPRLKRFLSEVKEGVVPQTLLLHTLVGNTQEAKKELLEFADFEETENVLNSVKPTRLLCHLLKIGTSPDANDIVLDFFAGSGPMAHSVFVQNAEDNGNRRVILVQIPEPLPKPEKSVRTIADLAKSRIRNVARKLKQNGNDDESDNGSSKPDLGFRVFKLDSSNIQPWDPDRDDLGASLLRSVEHVKGDRTASDVLYELLLKLGLDLCVPIEQKKIAGKMVHCIGAGALIVCLADKVARGDVEDLAHGIADWHKALAPASETTVVFRDSAFADDVAKTNVTAILQQHGLENIRSL